MASANNANESSGPGFNTWTFGDACESMSPLNSLHRADLVIEGENEKAGADLLFVCHFSRGAETASSMGSLDAETHASISSLLEEHAETYKNGSKEGSVTPTLRTIDGRTKTQRRLVLVGMGEKGDDKDPSRSAKIGRSLGKAIATRCSEEASPKLARAAVLLPFSIGPGEAHVSCARELAAAFYSGLYADHRFRGSLESIQKPTVPARHLESVALRGYSDTGSSSSSETETGGFETAAMEDAVATGKAIARGVHLARDIVNAPHNVLNSLSLADLARTIASESMDGCLSCTILDKDDCEKRGMGAYLGVARASETPPRFIHLTYTPPTTGASGPNKKVGVVGKGLLFDTGGYNIKTAMMELMKFDCGGAAAVLGAALTTAALRPKGVECHFVVAACENMVNDRGIVPSDVLVASNGVTIEIQNTDAEGRLTLADALVYCDREVGCEKIVELSTLTGSCMVALGKEVCGVFTENDDLAGEIDAVSKATGEPSWRMPLVKSYEDQLRSKIADINNYGTRFGGSITAGLFLQHFVDTKRVPFAHIDIAGPVWNDSSGATGFGSRLVSEWIRRQGVAGGA
ncbi:unnamed protein product [Pseudo-nitzschia multistriata]|uniref:Cytosol aminopeptidase domain-containing protein n=1 Tax=Pseudo-nitzschia multistriata TaxID=183589 RepID=A0A448Z1A6_9STRA|nr:unnamed protein product [Pseudo-nitzschia multistriata]